MHESRLVDLKLKELKRSIRHKSLKPIAPTGPSPTRIQGQRGNDGIIHKKLVGGRITYQEANLTEENIRMHEKKYEGGKSQDQRSSMQKLKGPAMLSNGQDKSKIRADASPPQTTAKPTPKPDS